MASRYEKFHLESSRAAWLVVVHQNKGLLAVRVPLQPL